MVNGWGARPARLALTVFALAIVLVSSGPTSNAVAADARGKEGDSLASDAATIASHMGWTREYAVERLLHQERFGTLLEGLAEAFPATFGGGYTANGKVAESFVLFKGEVPGAAIDDASRFRVDTSFVPGALYSFAELEALATRIHADLSTAGWQAGTGFSIEKQRVEVSIARPAGLGDEADEGLLDTLPASARGSRVGVVFVDGPIDIKAHTYGGDKLRDDGVFECTSGFVVSDGTLWALRQLGTAWGSTNTDKRTAWSTQPFSRMAMKVLGATSSGIRPPIHISKSSMPTPWSYETS